MINKQQDLEVNREVRKVLVRHWIDLGRLSFRSVGGRVQMHGVLMRIPGVDTSLSGEIVTAMFREIGRIPGLVRVSAEIDNWSCSDGAWTQRDASGDTKKGEARAAGGATFDIKDGA